MSQKWIIRVAAVLATIAVGVPRAHGQFYMPGNFYGNGMGMYPGMGFGGGFGGYGGLGGGYGGYGGGFGGYGGLGGGGYGTMGYNAGVYTPGLNYGGYAAYSGPLLLGTETSSGAGRSTMSPAMAVAHDSPLLMAGYDAPTKDNRCVVVVVVPDANAQVWFQGSATAQTGRVRRFTTPALVPNKRYEYDVFVQWNEGGNLRTEPRTVQVQAGGVVNVLFANSTPVTK